MHKITFMAQGIVSILPTRQRAFNAHEGDVYGDYFNRSANMATHLTRVFVHSGMFHVSFSEDKLNYIALYLDFDNIEHLNIPETLTGFFRFITDFLASQE
jgi:hypothetical protein